jgi:ribosome biogenesis GTPase
MKQIGLVVARYRRHAIVEDSTGDRHRCLIRGRGIRPLAGDDVEWSMQPDGTRIVTRIGPRRSTLTRIDARGRPESVAANVTQLVAVAAPRPAPDWSLVDRYLVAAELEGIAALLVWNKRDLADGGPPAVYERIGYPVCATSARDGSGLDELARRLNGERSTLVGQSGVGKSSLINALLGEKIQATGDLSVKGRHGRHTTTTSVLHRLPDGGELIDSPGVRNYAPFIDDAAHLDRGFREMRAHIGHCRFDDCRHRAEPDCAIKAAVDDGEIDADRYASYLKLAETLEALVTRPQ